uniref:Large neutral amino acids transporter small subunit 2-like n=1 Tax=Taeniopygia guttata TaxID=59729 RepID=A0A674H0J9_TAEGU|nr:large neutral amino acids transporter small subunit 2-like [Taeniopygia guttata]
MESGPKNRGKNPKKEEKEDEEEGGVALKKEIGLLSACGIIVGNIIGSGIFVAPRGVLAHAGAVGPALLIWGLSGAVTALGALCYAELGVALPRPGGDYAYVGHAFGPLVGFLRLWISVLVIYPTNQAVIALTFANYVLQPLFPTCGTPEPALRVLAAACLLVLTWVNCGSVRWATRVQDVFTAGKLLALALIVGAGAALIARGEHEWLRPSRAFPAGPGPGAGPLFLACLQGSFAYGGWNFLNYVTEELRQPRRNLPLAIGISIPLVTFLYVAANVAYLAALSPREILQSPAVAVTFGERVLGPLAWVMPLAVALSTFGGVNGSLFTCSRLFYAGAREGQLPALLAMIHVRRHTPVPALLLTCVSTLLMLVTGDIDTLINYVGFVNYLWYGVTVAGLLLLRRREPRLPRPIKVPLLCPALYLLFWGALLLFSLWTEPLVCGIGLAVTATGAPVYLLCLRGGPRPPALRRALARLTLFGQRLLLVVYPGGGGAPERPSPTPEPLKRPSPT